MKEALQLLLAAANTFESATRYLSQLADRFRREVAQLTVLEPRPQLFHGHQFRPVGGQPFQDQTTLAFGNDRANRITLMHAAAIPNDHQRSELLPQSLQKDSHSLVIEVAILHDLVRQTDAISTWCQPQSGRDRYFLSMSAFVAQSWRTAPQRPAPPNQGQHQQPAFIDENEVRASAPGTFRIRGHCWISQSSSACWLRSRGIRLGRCRVKPCDRSQRARYRGLKSTRNSRRINLASRGADHRSPTKPSSLGELCNHRRMIFSWVRVSLEGRPQLGRAVKAAAPRHRTAATQRRTLAGWTSRMSATSSAENPSRTRWTASCRRCSNSSGDPGVLTHNHCATLAPNALYLCDMR